jgi:uridine kinase
VEGHLLFTNEELLKKFNLKVYIDTDDDVRLSRRILKISQKDGVDGQKSLDMLKDLLETYEKRIKPAYEKWIEPSKKYADIIIPNYGFSTDKLDLDNIVIPIPAVDLIIRQIESHLPK